MTGLVLLGSALFIFFTTWDPEATILFGIPGVALAATGRDHLARGTKARREIRVSRTHFIARHVGSGEDSENRPGEAIELKHLESLRVSDPLPLDPLGIFLNRRLAAASDEQQISFAAVLSESDQLWLADYLVARIAQLYDPDAKPILHASAAATRSRTPANPRIDRRRMRILLNARKHGALGIRIASSVSGEKEARVYALFNEVDWKGAGTLGALVFLLALAPFAVAVYGLLTGWDFSWIPDLGGKANALYIVGPVILIGSLLAWRSRRRRLRAALDNVAVCDAAWDLGLLSLTAPGTGEPVCSSPEDDWRAFVREHLAGRY